jgi:hypothetical protein
MANLAQATGYVKVGLLYIRQDTWPLKNGEVIITVERARAVRSPQANKYYWGVVMRVLSAETGYTIDEIHEMCKAKFLPRIVEIPGPGGAIVAEFRIGGSTRDLTSDQFWQYVEDIREWAHSSVVTADGRSMVYIPDPDKEWKWRHLTR